VDQSRNLWWIALSLVLLAAGLFYIDIYSGHIERSMTLVVLALMIGVCGLGLDLWARSSPRSLKPLFAVSKNPVVARLLFFGTMLTLIAAMVGTILAEPQLRWWRVFRIALFSVLGVVIYNQLITFIRRVRARSYDSTNN
jgi:hypothetical protein